MLIRPAVDSDLPYLYDICLKTGDAGKDAASLFYDPYLLGHYFAAPYLFFDKTLCFIVEEDYTPQGYMVAAGESLTFYRWLLETWLPPLRRRYPDPPPGGRVKSRYEQKMMVLLHQVPGLPETASPWFSRYPAHLHINLLPPVQGKGQGKTLMRTLFAELERRKIPGVHLGVGIENPAAIGFYQKTGFSVLQEEAWGITMGKELNHGF
ncbi:MAG: GNAT family N-acetyltransferase [Spirochaetaceae bacterium]|jgi:ribosomal protein S18 acetylase RimI-like enzyme|nr:GNAT family N-acetyltransferase [Spirochaetaceae bacterium]